MSKPEVSVVMSVYNGERYLPEAVESILNQTLANFEFIIINDGSTDSTGAILRRYQETDERLRVYGQENLGLIASLNKGCRLARGEYIARMDADDVSLPERLAKQVRYMEEHPEIGVLGTWVAFIDENGETRGDWCMPTLPGLLGWSLIFGNCLAHPAVMMRSEMVERLGYYQPEALHVEDYDLWTRASFFTRIANLAEILLKYRIWERSVSLQHTQIQQQNDLRVMGAMITTLLGSEISTKSLLCLRRTVSGAALASLEEIEEAASLIQRLYRGYLKANSLSRAEIKIVAQDAIDKLCILAEWASKISLRRTLLILTEALRIHPLVLLSQLLTRGKSML